MAEDALSVELQLTEFRVTVGVTQAVGKLRDRGWYIEHDVPLSINKLGRGQVGPLDDIEVAKEVAMKVAAALERARIAIDEAKNEAHGSLFEVLDGFRGLEAA